MAKSNRRRLATSINAGSMADIAFLLLIFFLVTTQIDTDKGIFVKLPYWDTDIALTEVNTRNVFSIKVNRNNQLLVEGNLGQLEGLREQVKEFILNPSQKQHLASAPNKAVVAIQNDRGTSYQTYIGVYNEIKAAYMELWDEAAQRQYGLLFADLNQAGQVEIRKRIPSVISESEPTEF